MIAPFSFRCDQPFLEIGDTWQQVSDGNLTCAFLVSREAASRTAESRGGVIVHVGSDLTTQPRPLRVLFAAVKAGVRLMTVAMALDLAPLGVRVCPVATPRDTETATGGFVPGNEHVAAAVVRWASDRASYLLGSTFFPASPVRFRAA
jgi:NAD(P)-dependent dehydrogenase (short-subunit alcohol dehydrogenase family)